MQVPVIGVVADQRPARFGTRDLPFVGSFAQISEYIAAAGGAPLLIPPGLGKAAMQAIYARLDGLLLAGGGDIHPARYGAVDEHGLAGNVNPARDAAELEMTGWAVRDDLPVLGICRGHQLVNVALGGSLLIDIPSEVTSDLCHDTFDDQPLHHRAHDVGIEPDSRLAGIVGALTLCVNSLHHQAVQVAGDGLHVTARASDRIIEATEHRGARFLITVQWHPEMLYEQDAPSLALCRALVEAARTSRAAFVVRSVMTDLEM